MSPEVAEGDLEVHNSLAVSSGEAVGVGLVLLEHGHDAFGQLGQSDVDESVLVGTHTENGVLSGNLSVDGEVELTVLFGLSGSVDLSDSSVHSALKLKMNE